MKLEPTKVEYCFEMDKNGYKFNVTAIKDEEWGWEAQVVLSEWGKKTAEEAVKSLKRVCEEFLHQLDKEDE